MKNLMLSTAILTALASPLLAQTTTAPDTKNLFRAERASGDILASDFIGMRVYAADSAIDATGYKGVQDNWDDIGEINDVVLRQDGSVQAVLFDIGGFLGIGERQVAVQMPSIKFVTDDATADNPDDFFLVVNADRSMLEAAPAFGARTAGEAVSGTATDAPSATATTAEPDAVATGTRQPTARDGFAAVPTDAITADALTNAAAYDSEDKRIGEVSELVLAADGRVTQAILDVGGFLGIGEKRVALPVADIDILQSASGEIRVYVPHTKEQLEAMPEYQS